MLEQLTVTPETEPYHDMGYQSFLAGYEGFSVLWIIGICSEYQKCGDVSDHSPLHAIPYSFDYPIHSFSIFIPQSFPFLVHLHISNSPSPPKSLFHSMTIFSYDRVHQ